MSYSFGLRAASIAALLAAASTKFAEVGEQQPVHRADVDQHGKALAAVAEAVGDPPEGQVLSASVSGSCSTAQNPDGSWGPGLRHTSCTVSVGFADKAEGE